MISLCGVKFVVKKDEIQVLQMPRGSGLMNGGA